MQESSAQPPEVKQPSKKIELHPKWNRPMEANGTHTLKKKIFNYFIFESTDAATSKWKSISAIDFYFEIGVTFASIHTHQNMPNVLIGSLEAAESNADSEKATAAPRVAGRDGGLPHRERLAAVQQHLHGPLHVDPQQLLKRVVIPVLLQIRSCEDTADFIKAVNKRRETYQSGVTNRDDKIKEWLQSCLVTGGILLHLQSKDSQL